MVIGPKIVAWTVSSAIHLIMNQDTREMEWLLEWFEGNKLLLEEIKTKMPQVGYSVVDGCPAPSRPSRLNELLFLGPPHEINSVLRPVRQF